MSTNRPRQKPNVAPATEPAEQPDGGHQQWREVGGHAEQGDLGDGGQLEDAADEAERDQAQDGCGAQRHGASATSSALGRVSTCTRSRRRRSAAGATWMTPVELPLAGLDPLDRADRDPAREERLQARGLRPGGDDEVALAYVAGLRHEVEEQVARRAHGGLHQPGSPEPAAIAETPKSWSVSSVTTALPSETERTLPTSPCPLTTGWPTSTPSLEPLLISTVEYQVDGERAKTLRGHGLVGAQAAGAVEVHHPAQLGVLAALELEL